MTDVLFEIGTEELPATNLADMFESGDDILGQRLKKLFEDKRVSYKESRIWATPRRLIFWIGGVSAAQEAKENLLKGPSRQDSFGPDGQPTERLAGFLKAKGASVKDVEFRELQGKEYAYVRQAEKALSTEKVLPEIFTELIKAVPFPKQMKWDASGLYFSRPIRSLLCFYGAKPLTFSVGNLKTAPQTLIFSKAVRKKYPVKSISDYFALLKRQRIIADPAARKKVIREKLEAAAKKLGGRLYEDPFLLNEVNFLVESPSELSAPFDKEFLKLPFEVLTVSMARKQRIFGVVDKNNKLMPYLLAILDGAATASEKKTISYNVEQILRAKLQDSHFFYQEDTKAGLVKKREELKDLVFLKGAGSMLEKSERLTKLSKEMSKKLSLSGEESKSLERACFLCKADLLTLMVGEFPELQGIMGKYYALSAGESQEVSEAIGEQYLPRTVNDKLPATKTGALLSIFDKADLIVACFGLGLEPTSSLDPYGLRRSAGAIFKIILDKKFNISVKDLIGRAEAGVQNKITAFFKDRYKALLVEKGLRGDVVDAVLASGFENPMDVYRKAEAISKTLKAAYFPMAWKVAERTANILKSAPQDLKGTAIEPSLFTEDSERKLHGAYQAYQGRIETAKKSGDFALATSLYGEAFFDILNEFFEKVFVNAEDLRVRRNRLALLSSVRSIFAEDVADLSKIDVTKN